MVEQLHKKHLDLNTSKLVIVSERGFTGPARAYAEANGIVAGTSRSNRAPRQIDFPEDPQHDRPRDRHDGGPTGFW